MTSKKSYTQAELREIKIIIADFDGVFTDNQVYVGDDGREMIRCSRADGIGLARLKSMGIESVVISAEINPVVLKRCQKLKIECISDCRDKLSELKRILANKRVSPQYACYIGNDLPDLECMNYVGFPAAPSGTSVPEVLKIAKYVTKTKGGEGAVREICDLIYNSYKTK